MVKSFMHCVLCRLPKTEMGVNQQTFRTFFKGTKKSSPRKTFASMGFLAESKRFELSNGFRPLHDFQSCSLDQLGQLSTARLFILYTARKKKSRHFSVLICENFIRQAQKRAPPQVRLFRRRRRTVVSRSLDILKGRRADQKDCSNQSPRKQDFRFSAAKSTRARALFARARVKI